MTAFRYVPIEALATVVLVGLAAAAGAALPALRRREPAVAVLTAARVLLGGAVLAVLAVTMMSGAGGTGINLTPGAGIRSALSNVNSDLGLLNLLGNVLMFVPIGFLTPMATRLRFRGVVAACLVLSVAVELLQLTLGRSLDVDDVLLNTLGGAAGAAAVTSGHAAVRAPVNHGMSGIIAARSGPNANGAGLGSGRRRDHACF